MVSFRGQKSLATTPRSVSFRGLIQDFRRAFSPLSCEESPPGGNCPAKEVLVGKSNGTCHSVWEASENMGCYFRGCIFLLFKADLDIYFEAVIQLPHQDFHLAGLCKI